MKIEIEDLSYHARQTMELSGCAIEDAQWVTNIMRDEVFHSTLDWQTEAELRHGALEARQIFEENRASWEEYFNEGRRVFEERRARNEAEAQAKAHGQKPSEEIAPEPQSLSSLNDEIAKDRAELEQRTLAVAEREFAVAKREMAVAKREAEASA